jgi:hypothetical protein
VRVSRGRVANSAVKTPRRVIRIFCIIVLQKNYTHPTHCAGWVFVYPVILRVLASKFMALPRRWLISASEIMV